MQNNSKKDIPVNDLEKFGDVFIKKTRDNTIRNVNKMIDGIYQKNGEDYYTQLHLPQTLLTAGEYIDIMKRL